jgi:hypothetical protein
MKTTYLRQIATGGRCSLGSTQNALLRALFQFLQNLLKGRKIYFFHSESETLLDAGGEVFGGFDEAFSVIVM